MSVRNAVAPRLDGVRAIAKDNSFPFTARLKTNYSVEEKLRRSTIRLRQIDDIMGCRVIVPDRGAQDSFTTSIVGLSVSKVRDRRTNPSNGYRAVHVILGDRPFLEVQVRTTYQDVWAELSERVADRHGIEIKYGGGSKDTQVWLELASAYVDLVECESEALPDDTLATSRSSEREMAERELHFILDLARGDLL